LAWRDEFSTFAPPSCLLEDALDQVSSQVFIDLTVRKSVNLAAKMAVVGKISVSDNSLQMPLMIERE